MVGEVRVIEELQGSAVESGPVAIATPAFAAEHRTTPAGSGSSPAPGTTRRRADQPGDDRRHPKGRAGDGGDRGRSIEDEFLDGVSSAVDVVVIGLGGFALVAGVAGLVVLTQAVTRQVAAPSGWTIPSRRSA